MSDAWNIVEGILRRRMELDVTFTTHHSYDKEAPILELNWPDPSRDITIVTRELLTQMVVDLNFALRKVVELDPEAYMVYTTQRKRLVEEALGKGRPRERPDAGTI